MPADVRSIDALRDWQANLTTYGETLAEALAGVELEIRRGFDWLAEQLGRWQRAVRDHEQEVTQAKAELAARKFTDVNGRMPDTTVQEKMLRLAKARLEKAEDQVARVRSWTVKLPKMIEEVYRGPSTRLGSFLEGDLPRALTALDRRFSALEGYAGLRPDYSPGSGATAGSGSPPMPAAKPTIPSPPGGEGGRP